jgi:hypothetical protein
MKNIYIPDSYYIILYYSIQIIQIQIYKYININKNINNIAT